MKSLIIYLAKKYVISAINDILEKYKDDVAKVSQTIDIWIERLNKIISQLKAINDRVADGKIDDDEISSSIDEIEKLVKEF